MTVQMRYSPGEVRHDMSAPMERQRRRAIRGQDPRLERTAITRKFIQQRGEIIEMSVAFAHVDFSAETWFQLAFAKTQRMVLRPTAGKEKNYQHGSKRKRRRYVPADWVYYIQSAYPFQ